MIRPWGLSGTNINTRSRSRAATCPQPARQRRSHLSTLCRNVIIFLGLAALSLAATLSTPLYAGPNDSCGTSIRSATPGPIGTRVWYFGDQLVYEYNGGLSLAMGTGAPAFAFQEKTEKIIGVYPTRQSAYLVLTRQ